MSTRALLLFYFFGIHVVAACVAFYQLRNSPLWLLLAEAVFVASLLLGLWLVRSFFLPLQLVRSGAEMLADGDFTTEFREIAQPEFNSLIKVYNTMVGRLREERLRVEERNELLDRVVEASPGGIVVCGFDGEIVSVNPGAERILGLRDQDVKGRRADSIELLQTAADAAAGTPHIVSAGSGRRLRVTKAEFRDRGFMRTLFVVEELTEELRQSERDAYGKLIRMISHEVNNSVAPVSSLVDSVRGYGVGLDGNARERFERGLDIAAGRLDHLRGFVEGFADVVRLPAPRTSACAIDPMIEDVLLLMQPWFDDLGVTVKPDLQVELGLVRADKNQLEQVLINVLKNAAESAGSGGTVVVRQSVDGARRVIEIEDDGEGLSADVQRQLFKPFYTTKERGRGIGLTLVSEILNGHGFGYSLRNRTPPEQGARFQIVIPPSAATPTA